MAAVGHNFPILNVLFNICEVLGNGLLWFAFSFYYLYYGKSEFLEHIVNFLYGLILDVVIVSTIKSIVKRERPNKSKLDIGPDQYSFPSGHSSRAVFIACFLTKEFKIRKAGDKFQRAKLNSGSKLLQLTTTIKISKMFFCM